MPLRRFLPGLALLVAALAVPPVSRAEAAVASSELDTFVGLAVFGSGGGVTHTCSGVLLSPRVFLTAGHCTDGADVALVWFGPTVTFAPSAAATGLPMTHPEFNAYAGPSQGADVGVVLLEEAVDIPTYATLPDLGELDSLLDSARGAAPVFTIVGYGLQAVASFMQQERLRYRGTSIEFDLGLAAFDDDIVHLYGSGRRRAGRASCLGDLDGPALLSGSTTVVGLGAFSTESDCLGVGAYSRLDTPRVQEFILSFRQ
jgi:secreted trypsin-like serine protease